MKSTAPRPRCSRLCWKRWRRGRLPWMALPIKCPRLSMSWPPKTPSNTRALSPSRKPSWTGFCCASTSAIPTPSEEVAIIERQQIIHPIEQIGHVVEAADVLMLQETVKKIYVDDFVKQYIVALVEATRHHPSIYLGSSPRGSLALFRTAQARALLLGGTTFCPMISKPWPSRL